MRIFISLSSSGQIPALLKYALRSLRRMPTVKHISTPMEVAKGFKFNVYFERDVIPSDVERVRELISDEAGNQPIQIRTTSGKASRGLSRLGRNAVAVTISQG